MRNVAIENRKKDQPSTGNIRPASWFLQPLAPKLLQSRQAAGRPHPSHQPSTLPRNTFCLPKHMETGHRLEITSRTSPSFCRLQNKTHATFHTVANPASEILFWALSILTPRRSLAPSRLAFYFRSVCLACETAPPWPPSPLSHGIPSWRPPLTQTSPMSAPSRGLVISFQYRGLDAIGWKARPDSSCIIRANHLCWHHVISLF